MQKHNGFKKRRSAVTIIMIFLIFSTVIAMFFFNCSSTKTNVDTAANIIKLGYYLFYDRRLSINNTRSCGTCNNPRFAFTDGYKRSLGVYADLHHFVQ